MQGEGRIPPGKLANHIQRYLKCKEFPEHTKRQTMEYLTKQLFIMRPEEEYTKDYNQQLAYLTSLAPRQVCQYQFKNNDIVWICKECQRDETCVICNECYQASNHEGHDVYFYHSVSGGCCDCGDGEAWNCKGFCDKHGNRREDPMSFIPREIGRVSELVFDTIAESLLQFATYMSTLYDTDAPRRERADDLCATRLVVDEYHSSEEFLNLLGRAEAPTSLGTFMGVGYADLLTGTFEECRASANELQMRGYNALVGYASDRALETRMLAAVNCLHELAKCNDGMCGIICSVLDEDILARILSYHPLLSRELGRAIYDLLMVLMAEQSFKIVIAVAYTQAYPKIVRLYGRGLSHSATSVYALSVQFLNREVFVNDVCFAHNFLKINIAALNALLTQAQQMSQQEAPPIQEGNSLSAAMTRALYQPIIEKRRYNPIIGDLKVIFTNRRISRYFLSCCLEGFLGLLESYQYLHPQERALHVHVEYEDQLWMAAFNLNLGVTGIFDLLFNWFGDANASCRMEIKYLGYETHPDSFEVVSCQEDGWVPAPVATTTEASPWASAFGQTLRSRLDRFFFSSTATAQDGHALTGAGTATTVPTVDAAAAGIAGTKQGADGKLPEGHHALFSVWHILREFTARCFAWERRFRGTVGVGVALPSRQHALRRSYAPYGIGTGGGAGSSEDTQLIDLIQEYAQQGVGKLPRLMSFHLPLHRTLAHAIHECCKHPHLVVCLRSLQGYIAEQAAANSALLTGSIDLPLFTVVMDTQINLRMWSRNGATMADQALNYDSYPFCRIYKELDTLLIQFLLTVHPTDEFVPQLLYRFGVAEYLAHRTVTAIGTAAVRDASHLPALLDESLKYIVNLVTELPLPPLLSEQPNQDGGETTTSAADRRLLPLIRREFVHKLVGGAATYSQLQECFSINPESAKVATELIDRLVQEIAVKHDSALGPPTYTLKKELWAEYDPCFPRVPSSVHQKTFEDRPKVTAPAPIVTKPFPCHECFSAVRETMLLTPVLLRVQRDLLFVAAAERCAKKDVYKTVREKWTLKCNDAIYGKVLQLLTLAVYVTQDLKAATPAASAGASGGAAQQAAATALERFFCEECTLPSSEDSLTAHMFTIETALLRQGVKMPCLLHLLLDIYYANDPLDTSSKRWVQWLVDQLCAMSPDCAQSAARYRTENGVTSDTGSGAAGSEGATAATASAGGTAAPSSAKKAMTAAERAMEAMKAKAAQFALMMGDDTDSDEEDDDMGLESGSGSKVEAKETTAVAKDSKGWDTTTLGDSDGEELGPEKKGVVSSDKVVSTKLRSVASVGGAGKKQAQPQGGGGPAQAGSLKSTGPVGPLGAAMEFAHPDDATNIGLSERSAAPTATGTPVPTAASATEEDGVPVCIICQADANAEDSSGNIRILGYLALVQASKLLTHDCLDCATGMKVVDGLPIIPAKALPKRPSHESNINVSFCGHGMHQDCFNVYQRSQLSKASEQNDMVLDKTRLQFCCPLCKKLGNVFLPYAETDPARMEAREAARAKLTAALKRKQAQLREAEQARLAAAADPNVEMNVKSEEPLASSVVIRPDPTALPLPAVTMLPAPLERAAQHLQVPQQAAACQQVWSLAAWLRHPSLTNSDLGAFTRGPGGSGASPHQVSFTALKDSDGGNNALKRARSQTCDSSDFGRVAAKLNTNSDTPEFASTPVPPSAAGDPSAQQPMDTVGTDIAINVPIAEDEGEFDAFDAYGMGFGLNDIDLNSTSTERAAAASHALDADLRGISLDATSASMDEYDHDAEDEYSTLLDFVQTETGLGVDPARALDRTQRRVDKIVETLSRHGREDYVADYLQRSTWWKFLEDYLAVYSEGGPMGPTALGARFTPLGHVLPYLQPLLRSIAYSTSCDLAEHNLPGYHLLKEADWQQMSAVGGGALGALPVSGEKGPAVASPSAATSAPAPGEPSALAYVKKYSIGMDEYRYLDKAVDAVACLVNAFGGRDTLDHALTTMFQGSSHETASGSAARDDGTTSWLKAVGPLFPTAQQSRAVPTTVTAVPLLAAPLMDVLVLATALAKAAPASGADSAASSPAKALRSPLQGVAYHPLWNLQHALRFLCLARLVQLIVSEVEETGCAWTGDAEAFEAFPSVSSLLTSVLSHPALSEIAARRHGSTSSTEAPLAWTAQHTQRVLFDWLAFLRASAHFVYRTCVPLVAASAHVENGIRPPQDWLREDVAPVFLQSATEVTDAQIRKHLARVPDLIDGDSLCASNGAEGGHSAADSNHPSDLTTATVAVDAWLPDLAQWATKRVPAVQAGASAMDIGVSTQAEVTAAIAKEGTLFAGAMPVLKEAADSQLAPASPLYRSLPSFLRRSSVLACYPRLVRPQLIKLPREYTKLHALVLSKIATHRANHPDAAPRPAGDGKPGEFDHPALCLVCAAVLDGGGRGQCAAHSIACGGESGAYFLLQECQVLLSHGPRGIYYASPYIDVYGESQHNFRGKPLYLDSRRYEALNHLWATHQIPREVASKRSTATRIIINNYY